MTGTQSKKNARCKSARHPPQLLQNISRLVESQPIKLHIQDRSSVGSVYFHIYFAQLLCRYYINGWCTNSGPYIGSTIYTLNLHSNM